MCSLLQYKSLNIQAISQYMDLINLNQFQDSHNITLNNIVVALRGGPQPGGVVHSPNPRGWLLGEVQAIPQIYS